MPDVSAVQPFATTPARSAIPAGGDGEAFARALAGAADPAPLAAARQDIAADGSNAPVSAAVAAQTAALTTPLDPRAVSVAASPIAQDDAPDDSGPTGYDDADGERDPAPLDAVAPVPLPVALVIVPLPAPPTATATAAASGEPLSARAAAPLPAAIPDGQRAGAPSADKPPAPPSGASDPAAPLAPDAQPPINRDTRTPKLDHAFAVLAPAQTRAPLPRVEAAPLPPALKLVNAATPAPVPLAASAAPPAPGGAPIPAARAFARALASTRPVADTADPSAPLIAAAASPAEIRAPIAAPPALDTTRDDWPQRLIDRAEAARDAQNAADTRIRLVPEALGKIDIALRQEGTTLHVHFNADLPATRDLLADAQPRLAAAAEARGLRLGDTSVDGGTAQQGSPRFASTPPAPTRARANRLASVDALELATAPGGRIA